MIKNALNKRLSSYITNLEIGLIGCIESFFVKVYSRILLVVLKSQKDCICFSLLTFRRREGVMC